MKTVELRNSISTNMQKLNIPVSIINDAFMHSLHPNPENDEYTVKQTEENGAVVLEFECRSGSINYNYRLVVDSKNNKYSMTTERTIKSNFQTTSYEVETVNVEHTNNSWNNKPGFIVTSDERSTLVDTERRDFIDNMTERRSLYDDNGIEFQEETVRKEFPRRDYKGDFIFGLPRVNFRSFTNKYTNLTIREGLDKAVNYSQVFDALGNQIRKDESYYHLSNEHGLGTMNFNLGTITKEQYDSISSKYSDEELEYLTSNDSEITREGLKSLYSISRTL